MTVSLELNREPLQEAFRSWLADQESVDAQLAESLSALSAYQSHLDAWQQQLSGERDELRALREQIDHDRSAATTNHTQELAEAAKELNAARDKVAALTAMLLSRTEELRTLDNRRAEAATELELVRAREKELKNALEEQKQAMEREREHWSQELRHMRELFERQLDEPAAPQDEPPVKTQPAVEHAQSAPPKSTETAQQNPVLGSIVEQFGKLRQQRSNDRHTFRRPR